jgi:hypothetical protein
VVERYQGEATRTRNPHVCSIDRAKAGAGGDPGNGVRGARTYGDELSGCEIAIQVLLNGRIGSAAPDKCRRDFDIEDGGDHDRVESSE